MHRIRFAAKRIPPRGIFSLSSPPKRFSHSYVAQRLVSLRQHPQSQRQTPVLFQTSILDKNLHSLESRNFFTCSVRLQDEREMTASPACTVAVEVKKESDTETLDQKSIETPRKNRYEKKNWDDVEIDFKRLPKSFTHCNGCGAPFQTEEEIKPGYIKHSVLAKNLDKYREYRAKKAKAREMTQELPKETIQTLLTLEDDGNMPTLSLLKEGLSRRDRFAKCYRCHRWEYQSEIVPVSIKDEWTVIKNVKNTEALIVLVVDGLDFPQSCLTSISDHIGKDKNVILAFNKIDLFRKGFNSAKGEQDSNFSQRQRDHKKNILECILGFAAKHKEFPNLIDVCLLSAKTNEGIDDLRVSMEKYKKGRDVYFVGRANSGKSSLINKLIHMYKHESENFNACPTTVCAVPGTTLNMLAIPMVPPHLMNQSWQPGDSGYIFDTPGIFKPNPIRSVLTMQENKMLSSKVPFVPQTILLKEGMSLFLGGLVKINLEEGDHCYLTVMCPLDVVLKVKATDKSDDVMYKHWSRRRTQALKLPSFEHPHNEIPSHRPDNMDEVYFKEMLDDLQSLKYNDWQTKIKKRIFDRIDGIKFTGEGLGHSCLELATSGLGWVGLSATFDTTCTLSVESAKGFSTLPRPPFTPLTVQLRGPRKRTRQGDRLYGYKRRVK